MSQGQKSLRKLQIEFQMPAVSGNRWVRGSKCINLKENCPQVSGEMEQVDLDAKRQSRCLCKRICWGYSQAGKTSRDMHEAWHAGVGVGLKWGADCFWGMQLYFKEENYSGLESPWSVNGLERITTTLHVKGTFATKPKYLIRDLWVLEGTNSALGRTLPDIHKPLRFNPSRASL